MILIKFIKINLILQKFSMSEEIELNEICEECEKSEESENERARINRTLLLFKFKIILDIKIAIKKKVV